jgi:hypothetical protein
MRCIDGSWAPSRKRIRRMCKDIRMGRNGEVGWSKAERERRKVTHNPPALLHLFHGPVET